MTQNKKPFVIGLTGASGSGKSAVAEILASLGCLIIDCDKTAHENMAKGGVAYNDIIKTFGSGILSPSGEIDRKVLGTIVFGDGDKLSKLNAITHSHIKNKVWQIIADNGEYACIVIDAPLLFEADMAGCCDSLWLVTADKATRLERVMQRDGIDAAAAEKRFLHQSAALSHKELFDVVILNEYKNKKELEADIKTHFNALPI